MTFVEHPPMATMLKSVIIPPVRHPVIRTQFRPVNDHFPAHRRMERISIDGDKSY